MNKNVLIIDEARFSRICSAILELEGFNSVTMSGLTCGVAQTCGQDIGLIITSYPFGAFLFDELRKLEVPVILLSDHLSGDLIETLRGFSNSYCMIKPLDYHQFRSVVQQAMNIGSADTGRCSVV